uniref:De novo design protein -NA05 n=1 Tax=synthetic construct TaxID=32630 RepID=UPI0034E0578B
GKLPEEELKKKIEEFANFFIENKDVDLDELADKILEIAEETGTHIGDIYEQLVALAPDEETLRTLTLALVRLLGRRKEPLDLDLVRLLVETLVLDLGATDLAVEVVKLAFSLAKKKEQLEKLLKAIDEVIEKARKEKGMDAAAEKLREVKEKYLLEHHHHHH